MPAQPITQRDEPPGRPLVGITPRVSWLGRGRRLAETLGELAIFNGLYGAALLGLALDAGGRAWSPGLLLAALLSAHATFLLDRVKPLDSWLDPADAEARPRRQRLLQRFGLVLRIWVVLASGLAAWLLGRLEPWLALAPALSLVGVLVYAGRPRGPSLKAHGWLKSLATAASLAGWAGLLAWRGGLELDLAALVSAGLLPQILADAWLCDLPDLPSDARHGVRSLATRLGPRGLLRLCLPAVLLGPALVSTAQLLWLGTWALTAHLLAQAALSLLLIGLAWSRGERRSSAWLRDAVDLRGPGVVLLVHLLLR